MKKIFRTALALMSGLMLLPITASAQMPEQLPVDSAVRIGTLPNGLTYYIRHNEYPKGQADFYIAQKVGSILENDDQRGLAHFLEHMCFNGTKNFPGNTLIEWCETVGIKFGANLNAYTGVDQTVYNISNVPTARTGVQDTCLLILHDWADDLLLDGEEIDKERGVIHEEWRQSMSGSMRIIESLLPTIYPDSKYGYRLPIGTMDVVDNFPHKALRDYYEKWYRPDQQGVIVVGDIDVDRIEAKIKELFGPIAMPSDATPREYLAVQDTPGTIVAVGHDKEQGNAQVQMMFKSDPLPREMRNTMMFYVQNYIEYMIEHMLQTRLDDIMSKADSPFAAAGMGFGEFFLAKTKDAMSIYSIAKDGNILPGLQAAYRELLRAAQGGFTDSEYQRAKDEFLSRIEKQYNNRDSRTNNQFVQAYVNNFLDGDPIAPADVDYNLDKSIAQMIPLNVINQSLQEMVKATKDNNRVIMALLPDNAEGVYPTETEILKAVNDVDAETLEAFVDNVKTEPLIANMLKPGKIVKTSELEEWDGEEWTLSNGARVIVKHTEFKKDEILFNAFEVGRGTSQFGNDYLNSITFMPVALQSKGFGTYTNSDLNKYLAGKQASVGLSFSNYEGSISGSTTPKDLPTLMELIYSAFTDVNLDPEEFGALQATYTGVLQNQENDPQYQFGKYLLKTMYPSGRVRQLSPEAVAGASREQILEMVKSFTANAADYTFVFVGNVDSEILRPLVEKYIASLPGDPKKSVHGVKTFSPELKLIKGSGVDRSSVEMETPTSYACVLEWGEIPYTSKNAKEVSALGQILSKRLVEKVREKEQAVYSIYAIADIDRLEDGQNATIISQFPFKPELEQKVLDIISGEFKDMESNITEEELGRVREYALKNIAQGREQNGTWMSWISGWAQNGVNNYAEAEQMWNAMTVKDLQEMMKKMNAQGNYRVIILQPQAK